MSQLGLAPSVRTQSLCEGRLQKELCTTGVPLNKERWAGSQKLEGFWRWDTEILPKRKRKEQVSSLSMTQFACLLPSCSNQRHTAFCLDSIVLNRKKCGSSSILLPPCSRLKCNGEGALHRWPRRFSTLS